MMRLPNVLIIEDHEIYRQGLTDFLHGKSANVVGGASSTQEARIMLVGNDIDLVIMDIHLLGSNGLDSVRALRATNGAFKLIIHSAYQEAAYVGEAIEIGVDGFVAKADSGQELVQAISRVMAGKKYYSTSITQVIVDNYAKAKVNPEPPSIPITRRELEILRGIAMGQTSLAIAERLFISYRTVETHRSNLLRKFEARNSIELINRAQQLKLV